MFVYAIFIAMIIYFFVLNHKRRSAYRDFAHENNARYEPDGALGLGSISGLWNTRPFKVEIKEEQKAGYTFFHMFCKNPPRPLFLYGDFFRNFPNWKKAFTFQDRDSRVCPSFLGVRPIQLPLPEEARDDVRAIFSGLHVSDKRVLCKSYLIVKPELNLAMIQMKGIVFQKARLKRILFLLQTIAQNIESQQPGSPV